MARVSLENFSMAFGKTQVLENINFNVQEGEIVTILGPSGCGKSTILRSISSLENGYKGQVYINNHCLSKSSKEKCHKDVGYIFQDYALFPHLNVKDNIGFALYKLTKETKEKKVDNLLKQFDLLEHKYKQIHELSGGQQQRVSIARTLACEPKILLLDEPFANLDSILRNKTKVWLKKVIKNFNLSAILVTHDQKEALSMSNKLAIINNKKIEQFGTPRELFENPKSFYVANFLNRINLLPNKLLENIKFKIDKNSVAIIPIDKIKLSSNEGQIKATILDISFCGDYYELNLALNDFENFEIVVKSQFLGKFLQQNSCYVQINTNHIKIVKK